MLKISLLNKWLIFVSFSIALIVINWHIFKYTAHGYDFVTHAKFAFYSIQHDGAITPHFLYHIILFGVTSLFDGNYYLGTMLVMVASNLLVFLILVRFFSCGAGGLVTGSIWAFILSFINPPQLLYLFEGGASSLRETIIQLYFGYHYLNIYHNPTFILLKPVALLLFLFITDRNMRHGMFNISIAVTGAILCALIKPSFVMVAAPAAFFIWAVHLWRNKQNLGVLLGFWVGSIVVLLLQLQLYERFSESTEEGGRGIVFSPLTVLSGWSDFLFLKLIFSVLFVLVLLWFNRDLVRDSRFKFASLMFIVGCLFTYLFSESGKTASDANFIWCAQISIYMLFVSAIHRLGQEIASDGVRVMRNVIPLVVLFVYVGGGINWLVNGLKLNVP